MVQWMNPSDWPHSRSDFIRDVIHERDDRMVKRLYVLMDIQVSWGSDREICNRYGISRATLRRWRQQYESGGYDELRRHLDRDRPPTKRGKLDSKQAQELVNCWCNGRIHTVDEAIEFVDRNWAIHFTYQGMYALLRRLGVISTPHSASTETTQVRRAGRPRKLTDEQWSDLKRMAKAKEFDSAAKVQRYLQRAWQVDYSISGIYRLLQQAKRELRIPSKRSLFPKRVPR